MRYLLSLLMFMAICGATAQSRNIAPRNTQNTWYNNITADNKGGLYVIEHREHNNEIDYLLNNQWTVPKGVTSQPSDLCFSNGQLFLLDTQGEGFYKLWRLTDSGWRKIPLTPLNGYVFDMLNVPGKGLLVRGRFNDGKQPFYLAMFSNDQWQTIKPQMDDSVQLIMDKAMIEKPMIDAKGVVYFYTHFIWPMDGYNFLSWDGTSIKKMGTNYHYQLNEHVVTKDGHVFGGQMLKPGLVEWDGNKWNELKCNAEGYDGNITGALAVTDKDEILAGGYAKKGDAYVVYKYKNGKWSEYATVPSGPLDHFYYEGNTLYATVGNKIMLIPEGTVAKKAVRQDMFADSLWSIYKDFRSKESDILYWLNLDLQVFSPATDAGNAKLVAVKGTKAATDAAARIRQFITRIELLHIPTGKDPFAPVMLQYLRTMERYCNYAADAFRCYTKNQEDCYNKAAAVVKQAATDRRRQDKELKTAADQYLKRNDL